jgi:hypothetical protein
VPLPAPREPDGRALAVGFATPAGVKNPYGELVGALVEGVAAAAAAGGRGGVAPASTPPRPDEVDLAGICISWGST